MQTFSIALASLLVATIATAAQVVPRPLLSAVDHLVYATPDLTAGIDRIASLLGVREPVMQPDPYMTSRKAKVSTQVRMLPRSAARRSPFLGGSWCGNPAGARNRTYSARTWLEKPIIAAVRRVPALHS
jgi:hypothetical protein